MSLYEDLMDKLNGQEYGHYFSAWCIFDTHKSPALLVYNDGRFWCLSCRKSGSHEFLAKKLSMSVPLTQSQPSRILPQWKKWERQYGNLEGIARGAHESLKRSPKKWFKERKLDEYINSGWFGYLDGWCTFPVFSLDKELLDIVVRAIKGKGDTRYVVHPGDVSGSRPLYIPNPERVKEARTVYVPFGMIDAWALESIGLPAVTGITGKSIPLDRLQELNKRYILLPDRGEEDDAHKIANQFGMGARVKSLRFPEDTKDPDEIRRKFGSNHLLNLIGA